MALSLLPPPRTSKVPLLLRSPTGFVSLIVGNAFTAVLCNRGSEAWDPSVGVVRGAGALFSFPSPDSICSSSGHLHYSFLPSLNLMPSGGTQGERQRRKQRRDPEAGIRILPGTLANRSFKRLESEGGGAI